ncbi:MAG: hypothetical protein OXC80_14620 [Gammaproteobacteria bacterium]|nr:hypothetical protein [Gammaproteobacteria bacterium]
MSDKPLTEKERWANAIGVEHALYGRMADAFAKLGFSEEEIEFHLEIFEDLENDSCLVYPFTRHSAIYTSETPEEEAIAKGFEWNEANKGNDNSQA